MQLTTTDTEAKKEDCLKGFQKNLKKELVLQSLKLIFYQQFSNIQAITYCFKVSKYYETQDK